MQPQQASETASASQTESGGVLRLRGLPFQSGDLDIRAHFHGYEIVETYVCRRSGRCTGEAYAVFKTQAAAQQALQHRNNSYIGTRYIELFESSIESLQAVKRILEDVQLQGHVVRVSGLPPGVQVDDVARCFWGLKVKSGAHGIHLITRDSRLTGEAFVELVDRDSMLATLTRNGQELHGHEIQISESSVQELLQALHHTRWRKPLLQPPPLHPPPLQASDAPQHPVAAGAVAGATWPPVATQPPPPPAHWLPTPPGAAVVGVPPAAGAWHAVVPLHQLLMTPVIAPMAMLPMGGAHAGSPHPRFTGAAHVLGFGNEQHNLPQLQTAPHMPGAGWMGASMPMFMPAPASMLPAPGWTVLVRPHHALMHPPPPPPPPPPPRAPPPRQQAPSQQLQRQQQPERSHQPQPQPREERSYPPVPVSTQPHAIPAQQRWRQQLGQQTGHHPHMGAASAPPHAADRGLSWRQLGDSQHQKGNPAGPLDAAAGPSWLPPPAGVAVEQDTQATNAARRPETQANMPQPDTPQLSIPQPGMPLPAAPSFPSSPTRPGAGQHQAAPAEPSSAGG